MLPSTRAWIVHHTLGVTHFLEATSDFIKSQNALHIHLLPCRRNTAHPNPTPSYVWWKRTKLITTVIIIIIYVFDFEFDSFMSSVQQSSIKERFVWHSYSKRIIRERALRMSLGTLVGSLNIVGRHPGASRQGGLGSGQRHDPVYPIAQWPDVIR